MLLKLHWPWTIIAGLEIVVEVLALFSVAREKVAEGIDLIDIMTDLLTRYHVQCSFPVHIKQNITCTVGVFKGDLPNKKRGFLDFGCVETVCSMCEAYHSFKGRLWNDDICRQKGKFACHKAMHICSFGVRSLGTVSKKLHERGGWGHHIEYVHPVMTTRLKLPIDTFT